MAWQGFGVWSLVAQQLSNAAVATAVLWWATSWRPSFPPSKHHIRDLYAFATTIAGENLLWFTLNRTDQTAIGIAFGAAAVGPYALATRCIQLTMDAVVTPVQVVALPAFSRIQEERERVQSAFYRLTEIVAAVALPTFCGIAVLAPTFVPLVFGPAWNSSVSLLRALAISALLCIPVSFVHPLTLAIGKPKIALVLSVCHTLLTIALCVLAVRWSPLAVAGAVCLSMAIGSAVGLTVCRRLTGISIWMLASRLWVPAFASMIMSTALLAFQHFARELLGDPLTVAGGVVLGASLYGVGIGVLRPELIRQLSQLLSSRARLPRAAEF
jgi:PST family polysaccharide transporter